MKITDIKQGVYPLLISLMSFALLFVSSCSDEKDETNPTSGLRLSWYNSETNVCDYTFKAYDETAIKSIQIFKDDSLIYNSETKDRASVRRDESVSASCYYTPNGYKIISVVQDFDGNITRDTLQSPVISAVTLPKSGESVNAGSTQTITWSSNKFSETVNIDLYSGSMCFQSIAVNAPNTGKYQWTVPAALTAGADYFIRVSSSVISAAADRTEGFSVAPYIATDFPSTAVSKLTGDTLRIAWKDNISELTKIELYKSDKLYSTIISAVNANTYLWTIPTSLSDGSDYKIRITSLKNSTCVGETPLFTIQNRTIKISTPSVASGYNALSGLRIAWDDNFGENVKVDLYHSGSYLSTINSSTLSDGSYIWGIPYNLSGTSFSIRISSTLYVNSYAMSSTFSISPSESGSVTDIDGNSYKTLKIGTQTWMVENLRSTRLNDGQSIMNITTSDQWKSNANSNFNPAYCWCNFNSSNKNLYGAYYNDFAAIKNIAPTGWHVPNESEWLVLMNYLSSNGFGDDGNSNLSSALASYSGWTASSTPFSAGYSSTSNNSSGFNAVPCGAVSYINGTFGSFSQYALYRSCPAKYWGVLYSRNTILWFSETTLNVRSGGYSIRCVKN